VVISQAPFLPKAYENKVRTWIVQEGGSTSKIILQTNKRLLRQSPKGQVHHKAEKMRKQKEIHNIIVSNKNNAKKKKGKG